MRRPLALLALVAVTAACDGGGGANVPTVAIPSAEVDTRIVGGPAEQVAALREILAGMGPTGIERIEIEPGWQVYEEVDEVEVAVLFAVEGGRQNVRGKWESWLVAGVFRDASHPSGHPVVLLVKDAEGMRRLGRRTPRDPPPPPEATPEAAEALARRVEAAAAKTGATLVDFSILEPAGLAFAVTLETDDPASLLKHRLDPVIELFQDHARRYEGGYVRIVDDAGETVWYLAQAGRMGASTHGVTRELQACDPIPSRPHGAAPPPCPA